MIFDEEREVRKRKKAKYPGIGHNVNPQKFNGQSRPLKSRGTFLRRGTYVPSTQDKY